MFYPKKEEQDRGNLISLALIISEAPYENMKMDTPYRALKGLNYSYFSCSMILFTQCKIVLSRAKKKEFPLILNLLNRLATWDEILACIMLCSNVHSSLIAIKSEMPELKEWNVSFLIIEYKPF